MPILNEENACFIVTEKLYHLCWQLPFTIMLFRLVGNTDICTMMKQTQRDACNGGRGGLWSK